MVRQVLASVALGSLVAIAVSGCSDSAGPGAAAPLLSRDITVEQLAQALGSGPARLEIKLRPASLVAREVERKTPDEMMDEESIRAPVIAVTTSGDGGTLTLEIGGLQVDFGAGTRLRTENGDVGLDAFVAEIEAALAAGTEPFVRAKRPPAAEPQAPDDPTFLASEIRIRDRADEVELELNVDADNLTLTDTPSPDAVLTVLGVAIEIRATTGETELEDDLADEAETAFEGLVASVDVAAGTVTLAGGTVVRIVAGTEFEDDENDDDQRLGSLEAVADAIAAGLPVEAEGEGIVESTGPLTIVAREIEFEVEDDEDDDGEFEDLVQSVDLSTGTVTLAGGTVVRIVAGTEIKGASDEDNQGSDQQLGSLEELADALAVGFPVTAEGKGVVEMGDPLTIVASEIEFEIEDD
jgi:hypothetical protein